MEEIDRFVATGCPAVAEIVLVKDREEVLGDVGIEVEHSWGDVVGNGMGIDHGVDFLSGVSFAQNPVVDMAKQRIDEYVGVWVVEVEEMVVGEQNAGNGAGHAGDGVLEETAIGGRDVVGACTSEGVIEMDVGVVLGD